MTKLSIFCSVASAAFLTVQGFAPPIPCSKISTSTQLFMNRKKSKKKNSKSGSKGFGGAIGLGSKPSFPYAGGVLPGKISPQRLVVDESIVMPDYAQDGIPKKKSSQLLPWIIEVKKPEEIEKMRAAGKLGREILDLAGRAVAVGITTDEIDTIVHEAIIKAGSYPSPLNYHGFPKSCCTSVNG
jgi:methionyl aminopeptidase